MERSVPIRTTTVDQADTASATYSGRSGAGLRWRPHSVHGPKVLKYLRRALIPHGSLLRFRHWFFALPAVFIIYGLIFVLYEAVFAAWFVSPIVEEVLDNALEALDALQ